MEDKLYTKEEVEALKNEAYRSGYEDGFSEAQHLMGNPIITANDNEVMDKIKNNLDAFLIHLKW